MNQRRDNLKKYLPDALVEKLTDAAVLLDPEGLDEAVVGVAEGRAVYDYGKLIEAYMKVFGSDDERDEEARWVDAVEWVHYNTLRALPYLSLNVRPIITGMGDEEEDDEDDEDDE